MRIVRSQPGDFKHLKAVLVTHDRKRVVLARMQFLAPAQGRYTVANNQHTLHTGPSPNFFMMQQQKAQRLGLDP